MVMSRRSAELARPPRRESVGLGPGPRRQQQRRRGRGARAGGAGPSVASGARPGSRCAALRAQVGYLAGGEGHFGDRGASRAKGARGPRAQVARGGCVSGSAAQPVVVGVTRALARFGDRWDPGRVRERSARPG